MPEDHLDHHYEDDALARPVYGEITAIIPPDAAGDPSGQNWSDGTITLYQVTTNQQWPSVSEVLPPCPVMGQQHGLEDGIDDFEDTLAVGDQVVVGFLEMDPQRPIILGRAPTWETTSAPTESPNQPITRFRRRSTEVGIDKEGNASIQLADGKSFTVKDSAGAVVLELVKTGGVYEVHLGGNSGLKTLLQSSFVDILRTVLSPPIYVPTDPHVIALTNALLAGLTTSVRDANSTTVTKAK